MSKLDGTYRLGHVATFDAPVDKRGMDEIEIKDGQSHHIDAYGCRWDTTYEFIDEDHVRMTANADQSEADLNHPLAGQSGRATGENISYICDLKYAQKGNEIRLSGQIEVGDDTVFITLHKTT